jgi:HlyD family secretion protein
MTANVNIITSEKKDVLLVPNSALRVKIDQSAKERKSRGTSGTKKVWVLKDKKPQEVKVKLGVTDFNNTEVISGLSEGDEVVVDTTLKQDAGTNSGRGASAPHGRGMRF